MALAASETGHLVLGTMNTPSAAKTIDRLDRSLPARRSAAGAHDARRRPAPHRRASASSRRADGTGMVAAVELLPGSIALWSLIRDNKTFQIPSLQQRGKGFGIIRLDESLADLVRAGRDDPRRRARRTPRAPRSSRRARRRQARPQRGARRRRRSPKARAASSARPGSSSERRRLTMAADRCSLRPAPRGRRERPAPRRSATRR